MTNTRGLQSEGFDSSLHDSINIELNATTLRDQLSNISSRPPRPDSPFFKPSRVKKATLIKSISTPNGTHVETREERILRSQSGATDQFEKKSSVIGTVANLINCIVGAGIVGIPFALKQTGLLTGLILIFSVALLTDKSLRLLIETGKHASVQSYETLMEAAFGRPGFIFISINMFLMSYGAMVAYLLVLKDTIPAAVFGIPDTDHQATSFVLLVSSLAIILPLAMQRDMADLAKTSTLSVVFDLIMVVIVSLCSPVKESLESIGGVQALTSWDYNFRPSTLFVGLGVLSFAFVCQDSSFIIAGSLKRPTKDRWGIVTRSSLLTCAFLATLIGLTGFLGFSDDTQGNILNNFMDSETKNKVAYGFLPVEKATKLARILVGMTMFTVYPLASYVARHVLVVLLFVGRQAHEGDDHTVLARRDRRVILTFGLYIAAIVPAIMFNDTGIVLAITGAVAGSSLSYIGPGAVYLGIHGEYFLENFACWDVSSSEQALLMNYPTKIRRPGMLSSYLDCDDSVGLIATMFTMFLWYFSLMPLWCFIAKLGKDNFQKQQMEQLEKSPVPHRRLGKIINHSKQGGTSQKCDKQDQIHLASQPFVASMPLKKAHSLDYKPVTLEDQPLLANTFALIPPSGQNKSTYGTNSDSTYASTDDEFVENDPQDGAPSAADYLMAISYILLGIIALCAGLVSITQS